mgnify:FL=1
MRNIAEALRDIDLPDINSGGCGIAALAALRLAKKHNEEVNIVLLYKSDEKNWFESNQSLIKSGNIKDAFVPSHVAIIFDGITVDTSGIVEDYSYSYSQSDISEDELITLINHGDWNDRFQRDKDIPRIEKILGINLDDVKLQVIL